MKISLEWLSQYLPGPLDPQDAAEALTYGGLPVEVIEKHGDDTVIDVEVTSNRGDCLSHVGVARELGALLDRPINPVTPAAAEGRTPVSSVTSVRVEAPELCPHYTARVIRNVKIGPSPAWMVRRLEAVGLRSINNVVDVTNYVMFEMGQPLHAFDLDKLAEQRIVVRRAKGGERMTSIDGKQHELSAQMLVIADGTRPVALAGVMGGLESEVSNSTVNVLLESARFDPLSVRKTARALGMKSDSSYRFERQIDPALPERASLRAAELILQTAGGELLSGIISIEEKSHRPLRLSLRLAKLRSVLGVDLPKEAVLGALQRLQLAPALVGDRIEVTAPSWRLDLNIEVDLIEEVARVVGYEQIPLRDEIAIRLAPPNREQVTMSLIRSNLVAAGFFESLTVSFVTDALAGDFLPAGATGLLRADPMVRRDNAGLRPSILPGLLEAIRRNENAGTMGARLFEAGSTFMIDALGKPLESRRLALVGGEDYRQMRGAVEALLGRLNADRAVVVLPDQRAGYAAGACGRVEWGGQAIGHIGRIDRTVVEKLSLRELPVAAELDLALLLESAQHVPQLRPIPRFPSVRRDLSLVVSEPVRYEQVQSAIRTLALPHLEELEYVTTYRGKPLEKGTKSITITLVFRSPETTLTSEQVELSVQKAVGAAQEKLGATMRG